MTTEAPLTIHQAAESSGWSARMLRYIEANGLVVPDRSLSGYRLYRQAHIDRLRSLRALLDSHELTLADLVFAARLRREPELRREVSHWLDLPPVAADSAATANLEWLRFEQDKHMRLLASPGVLPPIDERSA